VLEGRLWEGITRIPTGRPALGRLVGSHDQVAQALLDYGAVGFSRFIISGYNAIEDARVFGRELMPRVKAAWPVRT
jgi:alkanesulfonate monooxygenase